MRTEDGAGEGHVVDAHHHLWDHVINPYPWLTSPDPDSPAAAVLERIGRYDVSDYRRDTAGWDVAATVHVQAEWDPADPVGETRWLQQRHEEVGLPTAIVAAARLEAEDVGPTLQGHRKHSAVRGIRQMLNWQRGRTQGIATRPDLMTNRAWRRGFGMLEPLGLSFDLQIYPAQMNMAAALAAAYPSTTIVLNHAGLPDDAADDRGTWREGLRRLADCENVTVKASGLARAGRPVECIREYLEEVLEIFGCQRVMFGSNLPIERLFGEPDASVVALASALASSTAAERAAIWAQTAARVYRLSL